MTMDFFLAIFNFIQLPTGGVFFKVFFIDYMQ